MNFRKTAESQLSRWIAAGTALGMVASAHAGLILSPLGGFTLFTEGDDEVVQVQLNDSYSFYGNSFNSIYVSTNGNLNFSGSNGFENVGYPSNSTGAMISPLWDDLTMFQNSRIIEQQEVGFFAITWSAMSTWFDLQQRHTFQVLVFNSNTIVSGFDFQTGDIAFAYGPMGDEVNNDEAATVGLNNSDGTKHSGLPGTGQTLVASSDIPKLDPTSPEFILFRFNGSGYDVTYQNPNSNPVPEPSSLVVLGLGAVGLARKRRKRSH